MTEPTPYPSGAPTPYLSVSTDRVPLTGSLQPAPEPEPEPTPEPEPAPAGQAPQSEQSVRLRPAVPPSDAKAAPAAPKTKVTLDLDALDAEQPRDDRPEPFSIRLHGEEFTFVDPEELDWQDLTVGQDNPRLMMHIILGDDEQRTRFFALKDVKVRHMRVITAGYQKHYGLGSEGEDDGSARS
jgi:hypothetical protein